MTLESTQIAEMPTAGSEATTGITAGGEEQDRYAGMLDIDAPESAPADNPQLDAEQPEGEEGLDENAVADPWDGYEDFEVDGIIKKVPSEWKEHLMKDADYRRKTQAVAERSRELEAREQQITQRYQQSEQEIAALVEITNLNNQLKPAESIDWSAELQRIMNDPKQHDDPLGWQNDINQFNAIRMQVQQLHEKRNGLMNQFHQAAQQRNATTQQETAKRLAETKQFAEKSIKGWTPELDQKITQFALSELGYTPEILTNGINPSNYKTLHLAYLGHQSQLRQQTARPTTQAPPPNATRTLSAKANAAVSLDPEHMSTEDYVKARMAGKLK